MMLHAEVPWVTSLRRTLASFSSILSVLAVGKPFYCVTLFTWSKKEGKLRIVWARLG